MNRSEKRGELHAALWLGLSIAGSIAFAAAYVLGGSTQAQGVALALACFGIAGALVTWSRELLPHGQVVDEQHPLRAPEAERADAVSRLLSGEAEIVGRRTWLVRLGWSAVGFLGLAALFPARSLGPSPQGQIGTSSWKSGLRLVREDGSLVRAELLEVGSVVTAFPEGLVGPDHAMNMANDAIMLVRVQQDALHLPDARRDWAPRGFIAYSKVCTHAGCPVALYRQGPQQLMCPCHQSTFDVLDGGSVVFGPAARSLPQLPLQIDADGTVRASGTMSGFVGPDAWETSSG
ncbi:MAG: Rieske (2Fe-2S) domain protein [Candidatus Eremiobacteraeota bacterium]|nr:Rieske (2Fe-2S) domain protein [Candidatus Eremiobacteraeota bacterium]